MNIKQSDILLNLSGVSGGYDKEREIVSMLDFEITKGDRIGIIGENGAGKSSIGKIIMGLLPYVKGDILFDSHNLNNYQTHERASLGIGYFFQGGRVFPNLSVQENLKIASLYNKNSNDRYTEYFAELELFKNSKRLKIKAGFLSGGEKNLLSLAMVIASVKNLKLLIADEPSAGLSPSNTNIMYRALDKLIREEKCSLLLIEQNQKFAKENSHKLFKLTNQKLIQL
jgi:branched-chain amino acid transport system ATP-binding protein